MAVTTPAQQHADGLIKARKVAKYLLKTYCQYSQAEIGGQAEGKIWTDAGARDSYHYLCDKWRLKRNG